MSFEAVHELPDAVWERTMQINATAPFAPSAKFCLRCSNTSTDASSTTGQAINVGGGFLQV